MFSTCICAVPQNQAPTNLLLLGRLGFQPIGAPAHARSQELGQSNSDETPYLQSDNFVTLQTRGGFSFLSTWVDPEVLGELSHRSALGTSRWRPSKCMKFHNTLRLQAIVNKSTSIICHDPYRCDPYTAPLKQKGILPSPLTGLWWWQPLLVYQRIFLVDLQGWSTLCRISLSSPSSRPLYCTRNIFTQQILLFAVGWRHSQCTLPGTIPQRNVFSPFWSLCLV